jgi:hypothetical protein
VIADAGYATINAAWFNVASAPGRRRAAAKARVAMRWVQFTFGSPRVR